MIGRNAVVMKIQIKVETFMTHLIRLQFTVDGKRVICDDKCTDVVLNI